MTLSEVLAFLDHQGNLEATPSGRLARWALSLDRMRTLCRRMGHPERAVPLLIHVAGTKGKGSTAAMIAGGLRAAGLRTGLYTSPHVISFWERIQVDGAPVRPAAFARLLAPHIPWARALPARERPTYFEWVTAAALAHFRATRSDAAVLEVGLGGRLDATNVVTPAVCAITRIDYDHTAILGTTLTRIAREKAGILKPGVPCVVGRQPTEALRAIRRRARTVGAPLQAAGPAPRLTLAMPGAHQRENAAVALGILDLLRHQGRIPLTPAAARRAVSHTTLPGRIQVVRRAPPLVVDGAHNPLAFQVLGLTLRKTFPGRRWTLVLGTASDKDLAGMLEPLKAWASRVVAVPYDHPRALDPGIIVRTAGRLGIPARAAPSVREALRKTSGPVCVAGSLWLAGEALRNRK